MFVFLRSVLETNDSVEVSPSSNCSHTVPSLPRQSFSKYYIRPTVCFYCPLQHYRMTSFVFCFFLFCFLQHFVTSVYSRNWRRSLFFVGYSQGQVLSHAMNGNASHQQRPLSPPSYPPPPVSLHTGLQRQSRSSGESWFS